MDWSGTPYYGWIWQEKWCQDFTDFSLTQYFRTFGANSWLTFGQMTITINNRWSLFTVLAIICGAFCPGCTVSWCRLNLILQPEHNFSYRYAGAGIEIFRLFFSKDQEHSWDQCKSEGKFFWRDRGGGNGCRLNLILRPEHNFSYRYAEGRDWNFQTFFQRPGTFLKSV